MTHTHTHTHRYTHSQILCNVTAGLIMADSNAPSTRETLGYGRVYSKREETERILWPFRIETHTPHTLTHTHTHTHTQKRTKKRTNGFEKEEEDEEIEWHVYLRRLFPPLLMCFIIFTIRCVCVCVCVCVCFIAGSWFPRRSTREDRSCRESFCRSEAKSDPF